MFAHSGSKSGSSRARSFISFASPTRHAPHIYTRKEVRQIIAAAKQIGPRGSLRPSVVATLVGLLYTTGLRIGEALRLALADVDLKKRLLLVRETKFKKSRYVPLSASAVVQLQGYLRQRRKAGMSTTADAPFFVNRRRKRYGPTAFATVFLEIIRKLGIRGPKGQVGPRVHHGSVAPRREAGNHPGREKGRRPVHRLGKVRLAERGPANVGPQTAFSEMRTPYFRADRGGGVRGQGG